MAALWCISRRRHPAKFRERSTRSRRSVVRLNGVIDSIGGGDVSRSGRLACFRLEKERIQLVTSTLDGSDVRQVATLQTRHYRYPRWSPDNQWIAFQAGDGFRWDIYYVSAGGGSASQSHERRQIHRGSDLASGQQRNRLCLEPRQHCSVSAAAGVVGGVVGPRRPPRQLTPAEASYEQPDVHESGLVSATRLQMRFDLWRYPIDGVTGNNGRPRPAGDAPDRTGLDADRRAGRRADCLSLRQRRPLQHLGDVEPGAHHARSRSKTIPAVADRYPDLVTGRAVDCVRIVQRQRPIRLRHLAGQAGWQRTAPARFQGSGRRLVTERRRHLLRGDRVQCHEEGRGGRWRAGDRAVGAGAQHDRRAWINGLLSRGARAHGRPAGVRDSRRTSRRRSGARHQDHRRIARRFLAGPIQPVALTRRQVAGDAAHRRLDHQHLGAVHRRRPMAAGHRFRRSRRFSSPDASRGRPTAGRSSQRSAKATPTSSCSTA